MPATIAYAEALESLKHAILLESNLMMQANLHETRGDMLKMLERREDAFQAYAQAHELSDDALQKARLNRKHNRRAEQERGNCRHAEQDQRIPES